MSDRDSAKILWDYLNCRQNPQKVTLIMGLGSPDITTAEYCSDLYQWNYAPQILFCGNRGRFTAKKETRTEADIFAARAMEIGVPDRVIVRETRSMNSGENMVFGYQAMKALKRVPESVLLVASPHMLRRAYATFQKQWGDARTKVIPTSIPISFEEACSLPGRSLSYLTHIMVGEVQRIIEFPKSGFGVEQMVPAKVREAYDTLVDHGYGEQLMKTLELTRFGNPVLRRVARQLNVDEITSYSVQKLIADIRHTNEANEYGVGLSAPQVGVSVALSLIDLKPTPNRPDIKPFQSVIINPSYRGIGKRVGKWEGCQSGGTGDDIMFAKTERYPTIRAAWYDEHGDLHREELSGFVAHVFQHEADHLKGILFVDRVKDTTTFMMADEYRKRIAKK